MTNFNNQGTKMSETDYNQFIRSFDVELLEDYKSYTKIQLIAICQRGQARVLKGKSKYYYWCKAMTILDDEAGEEDRQLLLYWENKEADQQAPPLPLTLPTEQMILELEAPPLPISLPPNMRTIWNYMSCDIKRIIFSYAFDKKSMKGVFKDINFIGKHINHNIHLVNMYVGWDEFTEEEKKDILHPKVSTILKDIKDKPENYCNNCSMFKASDTGECDCWFNDECYSESEEDC